jgi:hypothetical protein
MHTRAGTFLGFRYAEIYSRTPPAGIQNASLLCEPHKGFLYAPRINNDL